MATVAGAITAALQDLGLLESGETPSAEDSALALSRLNEWIDGLANESLTVYSHLRTTWTIVSGTASYTIGASGTINIARPVGPESILNIGFIDTSSTPDREQLLGRPLTEDAYAAINFKALESPYPQGWYYNPGYPLGTLTAWPVPTSSTLQGVIYTQVPVAQFAAITDPLALPPGYARFFRTNLALELSSAFQVPPPGALVQAAMESKASIKRANQRTSDLSTGLVAGIGSRRGLSSAAFYSGTF